LTRSTSSPASLPEQGAGVGRTRAIIGVLIWGLVPACYRGADGAAASDDAEGDAGDDDGSESAEGDSGEDPADHAGPFACDPDATIESLSMRRLSRTQYDNTLRDLLTWAAGADAGAAIHDDVAHLVAGIPEDARRPTNGSIGGGFRRTDQDVHQEHIDAGYRVALATATALTGSHLAAVAGDCAVDGDASNDDTCVDGFIRSFGERALRRPLADDEVAFYRAAFDADGTTVGMEPAAFADVIVVMLTAPQFLYLVEHGEEELEGGLVRLSAWELASRLSYHFWQSAPDDELFAAARSGALLDEEGYAEQVERMFADERTRAALAEFYSEWTHLDDLPAMHARVGTPVYDAILDGFVPTPETTANMAGEILTMAAYYTHSVDGSFADFFTSTRSFATTPDLAEIYGVQPWDGGEPPELPPERAGLIARAALVATGGLATRPVMKGVFIRSALLCDVLPPPPADAAGVEIELAPDATTRETVEEITEGEGSSCATCHAQLINPLGFATENFDPLGRTRTEELLFDPEGNLVGARPVDTTSIPRVDPGDETPSTGAADLTSMLVESERVQACFARQYLRWTFGRADDTARDGCVLNSLTHALVEGAPIAEVLRQIALRDEFKTRLIELDEGK